MGDLPPSLHGNYPASSLLRSSAPLAGASVLFGLVGPPLVPSPLASPSSVLKFRTKAHIQVMPPIRRTPPGQYVGCPPRCSRNTVNIPVLVSSLTFRRFHG